MVRPVVACLDTLQHPLEAHLVVVEVVEALLGGSVAHRWDSPAVLRVAQVVAAAHRSHPLLSLAEVLAAQQGASRQIEGEVVDAAASKEAGA